MTIEVDFIKNNKILFTATTWAGYIGVMTGLAPYKYSVALNYRRSNGTILTSIKRTLMRKWPAGYLLRYGLENEYSFVEMDKLLTLTELVSPCYLTLCDVDKTCKVLIRDCDKVVEKRESKYKLIQTNNDNESGINILYSNERRQKVVEILDVMEDNLTYEDIKKLFDKWPIINEETIYINIMDPSKNLLKTYLNLKN